MSTVRIGGFFTGLLVIKTDQPDLPRLGRNVFLFLSLSPSLLVFPPLALFLVIPRRYALPLYCILCNALHSFYVLTY